MMRRGRRHANHSLLFPQTHESRRSFGYIDSGPNRQRLNPFVADVPAGEHGARFLMSAFSSQG